MLKQINNITIKKWFSQCQALFDLYANNDSLPMIIEWALYQNYMNLKIHIDEYNSKVEKIIDKYGTLQSDGKKKIDTTSNTVMEMFNNELDKINSEQINIKIKTINHKYLRGFQGVTLEIMSLLNFMIS